VVSEVLWTEGALKAACCEEDLQVWAAMDQGDDQLAPVVGQSKRGADCTMTVLDRGEDDVVAASLVEQDGPACRIRFELDDMELWAQFVEHAGCVEGVAESVDACPEVEHEDLDLAVVRGMRDTAFDWESLESKLEEEGVRWSSSHAWWQS
jgi:hypothetical protein